jgi:CBS domain-containing protein
MATAMPALPASSGSSGEMPNAFDFSASPFDCLNEAERKIVRDSVDIAYFREGEVILEVGVTPAHLFVIVKGHVSQSDDGEAVAGYGPADCFDGRSLIAGRASSRFVAAEEVVAYLLAKEAVNTLISSNATFGALLFSDLSNKLGALAQRHEQREMHALTMSRVEEAFLRPAHVVEGAADIVSVARLMQAERCSSVLVRDGERLGIFTNTGLQRAVANGQPLERRHVRDLATFSLVSIAADAPLFDALTLMIRHQVHRLVVTDGPRIAGLLEQLDLLSFLSNHSYLITVRLVRAQSLEALRSEAGKITGFIALLHSSGTHIGQIGRLVQALNAKLFERTWQLIAPPELVAQSCLFVMGSEGRGEQLLKTDQDNGLVVQEDTTVSDAVVESSCLRFSAALREFGYPDCPGRVMVSNPAWRHRESEFRALVRRWVLLPEAEGLIALSTFIDAHAVAGDSSLLDGVRGEVDELVMSDDALLGRFARAIDLFPDAATGWWGRLLAFGEHEPQTLDLKRAGIFPIVHGVRTMALRDHVRATGTTARLEALVANGRIPLQLADDLRDSLHFLMGLKLKAGLAEWEVGHAVRGTAELQRLSSLERDLLKDALAVVKRFKVLVRHQFHVESE